MADEKWKGKVSAEVKGITADQVWILLADFCNLQKCMPNVDQCIKVEGEDGKPGLVRHIGHCVTTTTEEEQPPPSSLADTVEKKKVAIWADEKLVIIDERERFLSYEVIDNNFGIKSYEGAFRAVEVEGDGEVCRIEWSYISDPIEGMTFVDFEVHRAFLLNGMVEMIQAYFAVTTVSSVSA
ncbi:lachrymatory-factor synthase-like [Euphorbia lathyris]|uniref:lachrymatory-factor synthase-like n=1 Tax=Euphorbia lathyris TaxID=212925 RepID=UPI003313C79D